MSLSKVSILRVNVLGVVCLALATPGFACLWDYDTLHIERSRFPGALALITGKFARHSPAYYRWRVEDRQQRLADNPDDLTLYDDLAVAYDKLGEHDQAIATILEKEDRQPGLYETYANLGTFHIHAGNLEEGIQFIDKAIEINPDAHFGREIYQRLVVQYVLEKRQNGKVILPLEGEDHRFEVRGFAKFVLDQQLPGEDVSRQAKQAELARATKGVLGMMRFGNHDSPVLLECLGDLMVGDFQQDNKRLAARAFLQAAKQVPEDATRQAYRKRAMSALEMQTTQPGTTQELSLETLEATFDSERQEADDWYRQVESAEALWVEQGADVDEAFRQRFLTSPIDEQTGLGVQDRVGGPSVSWQRSLTWGGVAVLLVPAVILVVGGWCVFKLLRHSA